MHIPPIEKLVVTYYGRLTTVWTLCTTLVVLCGCAGGPGGLTSGKLALHAPQGAMAADDHLVVQVPTAAESRGAEAASPTAAPSAPAASQTAPNATTNRMVVNKEPTNPPQQVAQNGPSAAGARPAPQGPSAQVGPYPAGAPVPREAGNGAVVRGQSPGGPGYPSSPYDNRPLDNAPPGVNSPSRYPQAVSGGPVTAGSPPLVSGANGEAFNLPPAPPTFGNMPEPPTTEFAPENRYADLDAIVRETQTGRFQFGVGVNSDAGVTGQIVIDERNFDWQRLPKSGQDLINGEAFRGAGQGFRVEAMPGNQVQRYMVSFTEPYLFGYSPISLNLSGFYFQRGYYDYSEERLGGRAALGYRLSPDLSLAAALRAEDVDIFNPRVTGVPELDRIVGRSELYTGRVTLTSDTRDIPFFPTEGRYIELALEQGFGTFSFPRAELDLRRYFLVRQRPDTSGRHTLAFGLKLGFSGSDTPMYENYFAGGFSTLRGFNFRGASPVDNTVIVGGPFRLLGSAEYFFPLTADDMVKGVVFCDYGTVEQSIALNWDQFRVSPGFGLRINIPALGPAPLALDFAVPVAHAATDNIQNFSFFFGFGR